MTASTIDLTPFCAERDFACHSLTAPQVYKGHVYASNGKMAVRLPTEQPDTVTQGKTGLRTADDGIWPNVSKIGWPTSQEGGYEPWPLTPVYLVGEECAACDQTAAEGICDVCSGSGEEVRTKCGHEAECDGSGRVGGRNQPCDFCEGRAANEMPRSATVGDNQVCIVMDQAIRGLPNVRWRNIDPTKIHFVFDGGEGIVIPLVKSAARS